MVHTDPNHLDGEPGSIVTQSTGVITASAASPRAVPPSCPPNIDREINIGLIPGEDGVGQGPFGGRQSIDPQMPNNVIIYPGGGENTSAHPVRGELACQG